VRVRPPPPAPSESGAGDGEALGLARRAKDGTVRVSFQQGGPALCPPAPRAPVRQGNTENDLAFRLICHHCDGHRLHHHADRQSRPGPGLCRRHRARPDGLRPCRQARRQAQPRRPSEERNHPLHRRRRNHRRGPHQRAAELLPRNRLRDGPRQVPQPNPLPRARTTTSSQGTIGRADPGSTSTLPATTFSSGIPTTRPDSAPSWRSASGAGRPSCPGLPPRHLSTRNGRPNSARSAPRA
jgi:hypothetical protein